MELFHTSLIQNGMCADEKIIIKRSPFEYDTLNKLWGELDHRFCQQEKRLFKGWLVLDLWLTYEGFWGFQRSKGSRVLGINKDERG